MHNKWLQLTAPAVLRPIVAQCFAVNYCFESNLVWAATEPGVGQKTKSSSNRIENGFKRTVNIT